MLATLLLLIEVLERHTGLLSARLLPALRRERAGEPKPVTVKQPWPAKKSEPAPPQSSGAATSPDAAEEPEPAAIIDALRQARQQAKERTKR
jgi:hypothetical protein